MCHHTRQDISIVYLYFSIQVPPSVQCPHFNHTLFWPCVWSSIGMKEIPLYLGLNTIYSFTSLFSGWWRSAGFLIWLPSSAGLAWDGHSKWLTDSQQWIILFNGTQLLEPSHAGVFTCCGLLTARELASKWAHTENQCSEIAGRGSCLANNGSLQNLWNHLCECNGPKHPQACSDGGR